MEFLNLFGCCKVRGGVFVGVVTLIESILKAALCVLVIVRNGFIGEEYQKLFDKEKIHAEIYILLSIFGTICSSLLIHGSIKKSSGKIIWWIVYQGISIFHQIYFSVDVILILYHELLTSYLIEILASISIIFLCYILIEMYFMKYVVELYQEISESEIAYERRSSLIPTVSATVPPRQPRDILRDLTDRNNPMQSSIIKLLTELESNSPHDDTSPLINVRQ